MLATLLIQMQNLLSRFFLYQISAGSHYINALCYCREKNEANDMKIICLSPSATYRYSPTLQHAAARQIKSSKIIISMQRKNNFNTIPFCVCPSSIFSSMATFLHQKQLRRINQKLQSDVGKSVDFFFPGKLQQQRLRQVLRAQLRLPHSPCLLGDRLSSVISFKLLFREDYQFFFSKLSIVYHCKQVFK